MYPSGLKKSENQEDSGLHIHYSGEIGVKLRPFPNSNRIIWGLVVTVKG